SHSQNRHRAIVPGAAYMSPPVQNKLNPFKVETDSFLKKLDFNAGKLEQQIVNNFMGISPLLAKEIVHRAQLGNRESYQKAFFEVIEQIDQHQYEPSIWK